MAMPADWVFGEDCCAREEADEGGGRESRAIVVEQQCATNTNRCKYINENL
jgi:hypothetical protein